MESDEIKDEEVTTEEVTTEEESVVAPAEEKKTLFSKKKKEDIKKEVKESTGGQFDGFKDKDGNPIDPKRARNMRLDIRK
jgi:hypothetical protein